MLANWDKLFTMSSIIENVEIWDARHARKILSIVQDVFGDIKATEDMSKMVDNSYGEDEYDEYLDDWSHFIDDDDIFSMAIDNLTFTETDNSFIQDELNVSFH